ncbi:MAG: hypothetical protein HZA18_00060 [Nitrospirae bacterium]|nr:hypothetical protein [Nitrospirota bacterium]
MSYQTLRFAQGDSEGLFTISSDLIGALMGKNLIWKEIDLIVEFLHSLERRIPEEALRLPVLPASTPATPKPVFK